MKLFEKRFKIIEVRESGAVIVHRFKDKEMIKSYIEYFKNKANRYEMIGNDGMVAWV